MRTLYPIGKTLQEGRTTLAPPSNAAIRRRPLRRGCGKLTFAVPTKTDKVSVVLGKELLIPMRPMFAAQDSMKRKIITKARKDESVGNA